MKLKGLVFCLTLSLSGCGGSPDPPAHAKPVSAVSEDIVEPVENSETTRNEDAISRQEPTAEHRPGSLNQALQTGDWESAADILSGRLVANPNDLEALFYLANVRASQGQLQTAIDLLADVPPETPQAGLAALGASAHWCMELEQYAESEKRFRKILELAPEADMARRPLAYIYNRQGRRHEAVQLIRELASNGDVLLDELHALIAESDAIYDPPGTPPTQNTRPYWPIGPMGQARWEFTQGRFGEAAERVQSIIENGDASASAIAFYGLAVAEAQDDVQFGWWLTKVNDDVKKFPEYWAAIGTHAMTEGRFEEALRALAEAIDGNPTDVRATRRVIQGFRSLGNEAMTDQWVSKYEQLTDTIRLSVQIAEGRTDLIKDLIENLQQLDRQLEAILWTGVEASRFANAAEVMQQLNAQRLSVMEQDTAFPSRADKLGEWDFDQYPLPQIEAPPSSEAILGAKLAGAGTTHRDRPRLKAKFRNHSGFVGITHRYRVSVRPQVNAFALYQQNGGGVAAIDYDMDGDPDVYFAQGAADPPEFVAVASDQLFRNIASADARGVVNVTMESGVTEAAYTLGVTSGDWNQDGFPDLAVANIGPNVLLINQGDGTFEQIILNERASKNVMSTSLAMGDINGDRLPDLYVLNYLDDTGITTTPPVNDQGEALKSVSQHSFQPTTDDVWFNTAAGSRKYESVGGRAQDQRYGLGIVMTDINSDPGNEMFIGNDGGANQLWSYDPASSTWTDSAILRGCAFGSFGAPTASMGIAAGDLDGSGTLDFHVTNFYNESSCLYLQRDDQLRDLNVRFGIDRSSYKVLGFGAQAVDVAGDGYLDLIVGNGHIENLESLGTPFRHPMQLLENRGNRFDAATIEDPKSFWDQRHLIRSLIRLDFNHDGRADLLATDLLESPALLINETETSSHWLGLRLVGTASERDAIGAKVEVRLPVRSLYGWVTSGDGYLGKNENSLLFGLGSDAKVEQVIVTWPSGHKQAVESVPVDEYTLIVENEFGDSFEPDLFASPASR